jgi:excisionase family DNA binding protein
MKPGNTQFGMRENTASSRQHASRLAVRSVVARSDESSALHLQESPFTSPNDAAPAAARGSEVHGKHLLTVREVADLLQVPVSWVYGRTRKRSVGRLPGYRLGKYWRFREAEVLAWLESQDSRTRSL